MTAVASSLSASRQNFLDHTSAKYSFSVSSSDKKKKKKKKSKTATSHNLKVYHIKNCPYNKFVLWEISLTLTFLILLGNKKIFKSSRTQFCG